MESYIESEGLLWSGVLQGIPKATNQFQPIFEALTNCLESIEEKRRVNTTFKPFIRIVLHYNLNLEGGLDGLTHIVISDNGIGFDDTNFKRIKRFKDNTKGNNNKGSGRLQFVKFFSESHYQSIYEVDGKFRKRDLTLSKAPVFLQHNAILRVDGEIDSNLHSESGTILTLYNLLEKSDVKFYNQLTSKDVKNIIIQHYMLYFCAHRSSLPQISISFCQNGKVISEDEILLDDIPHPSRNEDDYIEIPLCNMSSDMKRIVPCDETVRINIKSYKLQSQQLPKNEIKVTCKGEVIDSVKVKIPCLPATLNIAGCHFLFLLSSEYFDNHVDETRSSLEILTKTEFKKKAKQYGSIRPQIVMNDLESSINNKAAEMYSEIAEQKDIRSRQIAKLKEMYLLSDDALTDIDLNDDVENILKKAYSYDARLIAERDAKYHAKLEELDELDTTSDSYRDDMRKLVNELTTCMPIQDKESLSRYVTHRRLVLDLMRKIINRETSVQNRVGARNEDEKLLHNLLFTQHSSDTGNSDLWMLNEDFLYFKGFSEHRLNKIEIDGKRLFRDEITEEEERYLTSLGEDRRIKRPDILLFPAEGKCIIVELKTLDTNLAEHINQIKRYSYFLRNFTNSEFSIKTFYGYLIGEALEPRDVIAVDPYFKWDHNQEFMYLPSSPVIFDGDFSGNNNGSLYMEVITYTKILERAERRNEVFLSKLFPVESQINESEIQGNSQPYSDLQTMLF